MMENNLIFSYFLACQPGKIPALPVVFKKKKVKTWQECRDLCDGNTECEFFKWKVSFEIENTI